MSVDPRNTLPTPDERDAHHELNNPATDPDPTEWPDPRDPTEGGDEPLGDDSHTPTGSTSTSEPHHDQDLVAQPSEEERKRDKLDG